MEVVKDGSVAELERWEETVICSDDDTDTGLTGKGCGAELKVAFTDMLLMWWHGTHFRHYYSGVRCPRCGKYNAVKLPDPLWEELFTPENKSRAVFSGVNDSIV